MNSFSPMIQLQLILPKTQVLRAINVLQPQQGRGMADYVPGMGNLAQNIKT